MLCPSSLSATHACVPSQDALTHLKAETGTSFQDDCAASNSQGSPGQNRNNTAAEFRCPYVVCQRCPYVVCQRRHNNALQHNTSRRS